MNFGANRSFDRSKPNSLALDNNGRLYLVMGTAIAFRACVFFLVVTLVALFQVVAVAAAEHSNSEGLIDIGGGRKMYLKCSGRGSPAVVLVGGLRASADDWDISDKSTPAVFTGVGKFTRVCACDRPGTPVGEKPSRSDPVPQPTTVKDAVADLHALLSAAGKAGPYVLVGHSYGGLIVRLYASTYPKEVSGLVLIDALSEGLQDAETPQQWAVQRKLIQNDDPENLALYPALERIDVDRSCDQIRAASALHPMPVVVLSADRPVGSSSSFDDRGRQATSRYPAGLRLCHRCRTEKSTGTARQACAERKAQYQHE